MRYMYAYTHIKTVFAHALDISVVSYPFGNCMHPDVGILHCGAGPVNINDLCSSRKKIINISSVYF